MDKKPFSDLRWKDNPFTTNSQCNSCVKYKGYAVCEVFGKDTPKDIIFNRAECEYRKEK